MEKDVMKEKIGDPYRSSSPQTPGMPKSAATSNKTSYSHVTSNKTSYSHVTSNKTSYSHVTRHHTHM